MEYIPNHWGILQSQTSPWSPSSRILVDTKLYCVCDSLDRPLQSEMVWNGDLLTVQKT